MKDVHACPEPAMIAAFFDGALGIQEARDVAAHLADCDDCVADVGDAVRFIQERMAGGRTLPWALSAAAAIAVAVIGGGAFILMHGGLHALRYQATIRSLASAASKAPRTVEPRLVGFDWSPMKENIRNGGARDAGQLRVEGEAGMLLQVSHDRHAEGVASLMVGESAEAIVALDAAAHEHPGDATIWSDLAAAYYADAIRTGQGGEVSRALDCVERGIAIKSTLPEAAFNRALILEKLGRRRDAARAWNAYLLLDQRSAWSAEARARRREPPH